MPLHILLNASLRRYFPDYNPLTGLSLDIPPGTSVSQVVARLGLPPEEVTLIMVDGRRRDMDYPLQGEERVGIFPPIGGG
ncbi:MAG: MoaD/ThiS family protein [Desulfobacca sp.]|uniref:MoaD/ThiS family protein n=1 Tax=Desulfobacca sp. TaxID=2067990 RepID=UPI00404AB407